MQSATNNCTKICNTSYSKQNASWCKNSRNIQCQSILSFNSYSPKKSQHNEIILHESRNFIKHWQVVLPYKSHKRFLWLYCIQTVLATPKQHFFSRVHFHLLYDTLGSIKMQFIHIKLLYSSTKLSVCLNH